MDSTSISTRPMLISAPGKTAAARSQHNRARSPMVIGLASKDSSEKESNTSGRDNPPSHHHGVNNYEGKKRKAHDPFVAESFVDTRSSGMPLCRAI
jgi:hypothetical protein